MTPHPCLYQSLSGLSLAYLGEWHQPCHSQWWTTFSDQQPTVYIRPLMTRAWLVHGHGTICLLPSWEKTICTVQRFQFYSIIFVMWSNRSSFFCTRQTYLDSLKEWICIHIFMRTTHRSMDSVLLMKLLLFSSAPPLLSPKHQSGWRWTACNWTLQSLNSCGVRRLASRIVCPTLHSTSVVISYNQWDVFETSGFS